MSSKTAPRSTTTFASTEATVPPRPTTTIPIGARAYSARAPKYQVWWDVARMLEASQLGSEAMRRLREEADTLTEQETEELLGQIEVTATMGGLEEAIVYGREEGDGRVTGGFLRRCLSKEDWQQVLAERDDDDSDLDLPDLVHAAIELRRTFQAWFDARSDTMGLPTPKIDEVLPKPKAKSGPANTSRTRK